MLSKQRGQNVIYFLCGIKVSSTVEAHCAKAAKFYRAGMSLQQVVHFHNHIAAEITPSAKSMLLQEAVAFEAQLKNIASKSTVMMWDSPEELERFAQGLMKSAETFKMKNERIKKEHKRLEELVLRLLETDLVRRMDKWKEIIASIRERVQVLSKIKEYSQFSKLLKTKHLVPNQKSYSFPSISCTFRR